MAMTAQGPHDQAEAENVISGALKSVFALSEAYPDLKANTNFLNLQAELSGTEGRIAYARQFYNDTVYPSNTKIETRSEVRRVGKENVSPCSSLWSPSHIKNTTTTIHY